LIQFEKLLGQELFNPPNVAGWKGGTTWIDSSSMMMRLRLPEIFFYDKEFMAQPKVSGADLDSDFAATQRSQERINENYLKQAIGGSLHQKGIYNKAPDLTFLQDGDLKHDIDFRQVYTTLLTNWMGVNGDKILGRKFETLGFA
jgi:hypothetical protein